MENTKGRQKIFGTAFGAEDFMSGLKRFFEEWKELKTEWKAFRTEYKNLFWILAVCVFLLYGIRVIHDNIYLDSEIMIQRTADMLRLWVGSGRYGLVLTNRLFGLTQRLVPFLDGALMAIGMWCTGIMLAFGVYGWCGRRREYGLFLYLFPILFVACPVFAEQFLFILQAAGISFGIFFCVLSVCFVNRWMYAEGSVWWLAPGLGFMVWAFGTYQAMMPLYLSLVLLSYLIVYMNGRGENAFFYGLRHAAVFFAGCVLYLILAAVTRKWVGIDSTYVEGQFHWSLDDWRGCFAAMKPGITMVLKAKALFFRKWYTLTMVLFSLQAMYLGWKKKTGGFNYACFLFGLALFLLSPFFLMLISGGVLPIRTQLVYEVPSAMFLAHLTVWPEREEKAENAVQTAWQSGNGVDLPHQEGIGAELPGLSGNTTQQVRRAGRQFLSLAMAAVCAFSAVRSGHSTVQLFQASWEVYRNDVLLANRLYGDICRAAGDRDMADCLVLFVGKHEQRLSGNAALGELVGASLFSVEAHTPLGISDRIATFFQILGMELKGPAPVPEQLAFYEKAVAYMEDAPDWPAEGSIRQLEDAVVVRLSEP